MLIQLKCSSCKSPSIVKESNESETVFICKNPECESFNCFTTARELFLKGEDYTIIEGLTGIQEYEEWNDEENKYISCKEKYENGEIIEAYRKENIVWKQIYKRQ